MGIGKYHPSFLSSRSFCISKVIRIEIKTKDIESIEKHITTDFEGQICYVLSFFVLLYPRLPNTTLMTMPVRHRHK